MTFRWFCFRRLLAGAALAALGTGALLVVGANPHAKTTPLLWPLGMALIASVPFVVVATRRGSVRAGLGMVLAAVAPLVAGAEPHWALPAAVAVQVALIFFARGYGWPGLLAGGASAVVLGPITCFAGYLLLLPAVTAASAECDFSAVALLAYPVLTAVVGMVLPLLAALAPERPSATA